MFRRWIGRTPIAATGALMLTVACFAVGVVMGLAACNHLGWSPFGIEMGDGYGALSILLVPILLIVLPLRFRPTRHAWAMMVLTEAGLCGGMLLGNLTDTEGLALGRAMGFVILWGIAVVVGSVVIAIVRPGSKVLTGPYCRGCGYCVVGLSEQRCPECGRPFTAAELGISED